MTTIRLDALRGDPRLLREAKAGEVRVLPSEKLTSRGRVHTYVFDVSDGLYASHDRYGERRWLVRNGEAIDVTLDPL